MSGGSLKAWNIQKTVISPKAWSQIYIKIILASKKYPV